MNAAVSFEAQLPQEYGNLYLSFLPLLENDSTVLIVLRQTGR